MADTDIPSYLSPAERQAWRLRLTAANQYNVFCHCRQCQKEWVASAPTPCSCGSRDVEAIACWQFPDD
ncbi:MAG: hypothetical protein VKK04_09220 [Synechococcales bacterium]|nr:hypothetical protein [Synechococcales bacterium]